MTRMVMTSLDDLVRQLLSAKKSSEVIPFHDPTGDSFGFSTEDTTYTVRRDVVIHTKCQRVFLNHIVWDAFVAAFPDRVINDKDVTDGTVGSDSYVVLH